MAGARSLPTKHVLLYHRPNPHRPGPHELALQTPPNLTELANPLTPSAYHLIHSFILYPKIYITYRIKSEKKENVKLFLKNLYFSPNPWISKDNIDKFLMAEFQNASGFFSALDF
jgi:hypothetical protein